MLVPAQVVLAIVISIVFKAIANKTMPMLNIIKPGSKYFQLLKPSDLLSKTTPIDSKKIVPNK